MEDAKETTSRCFFYLTPALKAINELEPGFKKRMPTLQLKIRVNQPPAGSHFDRYRLVFGLFLLSGLFVPPLASAQSNRSQNSPLVAVPFSELSDQRVSVLGVKALAMNPSIWKHMETESFIVHFLNAPIAHAVASEAEFYYRYLVRELTANPEAASKGHIYVFEDPEQWRQFCGQVALEPWTAAFTSGNELFVVRNPQQRLKGHALGHEIVHYMVHKFVEGKLPLWLEEGYAEDASMRAYISFLKSRGSLNVMTDHGPEGMIPLSRLQTITSYPPEPEVYIFYTHSRRLVRFLNGVSDRTAFLKFLKAMAMENNMENALRAAYGSRWMTVEDFEADFLKSLKFSGPES